MMLALGYGVVVAPMAEWWEFQETFVGNVKLFILLKVLE